MRSCASRSDHLVRHYIVFGPENQRASRDSVADRKIPRASYFGCHNTDVPRYRLVEVFYRSRSSDAHNQIDSVSPSGPGQSRLHGTYPQIRLSVNSDSERLPCVTPHSRLVNPNFRTTCAPRFALDTEAYYLNLGASDPSDQIGTSTKSTVTCLRTLLRIGFPPRLAPQSGACPLGK